MTSPLGQARGSVTIETGDALLALAALRRASASTVGSLNTVGRAAQVGGAAVAGVGAAVAFAFVKAAKVTAEFEFQLSYLNATVKANVLQVEQLRAAALRFGQESGFGPREVAAAFVELGKAGVTAEQIIGGVGKAMVTLGQSADIPLEKASSILVSTQATFGLLATEAQRTADIIQGAANASLIDVQDFGVTMKYVGNVAAASGIDLEDLSTAIALVGNEGIRGSTAGTSLRRMLLQLTPRTEKAGKAMKELGIISKDGTNRFYDQEGSAKSLRDIFEILQTSTENLTDAKKKDALATIFGDRAIATALATAQAGAEGYDEFNKQLNESTAAEIAAKRFDNLQGSLRKFKGSLEAAFIASGTATQGPLKDLVDDATTLVRVFGDLSPETQQNIAKFALMAAGAALLVGGVSILVGTVLRAVAVTKLLHGALGIATGTMARAGSQAKTTAYMMDRYGASAKQATRFTRLLNTALSAGFLLVATTVISHLVGMAQGAKNVREELDELMEGVSSPGDLSGLENVRNKMLETAFEAKRTREEMNLWQGALAVATGEMGRLKQTEASAAAEADRLGKANEQAYINLGKLAEASGISLTDLQNTAKAAGIDASQSIYVMGQPLLEFYHNTVKGKISSERLGKAVELIGEAAEGAEGQVVSLSDALNAITVVNIDAEQAQIAFQRAINDAGDAIKENGRKFKGNSDAALDNRDNLLQVAEAGLAVYEAQKKQEASEDVLRGTMAKTREAFIQTAIKMGMTRQAASDYATELGLIPPAKSTKITTPGLKEAKEAVVDYKKLIDDIDTVIKTIIDVAIAPVDPTPNTQGDIVDLLLNPTDPTKGMPAPTKKPAPKPVKAPPPPPKRPPVRGLPADRRVIAGIAASLPAITGGAGFTGAKGTTQGATTIDNSKTVVVDTKIETTEAPDPNLFGPLVAFRVRTA